VNQPRLPANGYESRVWKGNLRLVLWTGAWVAATALMRFALRFLWNKVPVITLLAIGLDLALGVAWILANKKYVMELDELQRKVYLNAVGIAAGVAMIAVPPLSVMDVYHVIPFHVNISHVMMLMGLTFIVSFVYGMLRYR
jgi:hypothetical protein